MSLDDEPHRPSRRLFDLVGALAAMLPDVTHPLLPLRPGGGPRWFEHFPGEHYNLLTALCTLLDPAVVWEFGTDTGMSTVALLEGLRPEAQLTTVDIDGWRTKRGPWLIEEDFASGRLTQIVCDMKAEALFAEHQASLADAELIFVDGPKDGATEAAFLERLALVPFRRNPIVVFDDIRLMNMVHVWRGLARPKMDLTSFGHWSGTGIVDWQTEARAPVIVPPPAPPKPPSAPEAGATRVRRPATTTNILVLCDAKPNYVPDLLLHGLRKLHGPAVVDHPRKDALYHGLLGQAYLDPIPDLMESDTAVDRLDVSAKLAGGFYDIVLCDVRAAEANRALLEGMRGKLALIDGEDRPQRIRPGNYVILRRETDGGDFSVPLPMAMPAELLAAIDRHADAPKTHSVAFLGSRSALTGERNALLDGLERALPDALIGSWDLAAGNWQGRDAYFRALQSCRAVLTLPGAGYDTFRYWENAACNAAHLATRMPLFIPHDFRDVDEILRVSDLSGLLASVERITSGATDWRELAECARDRLRRHHTTDRRAAYVLDRVAAAYAT